jgi:8-oxo-dGTP pyrophosphatase MutT (NUDIX family)
MKHAAGTLLICHDTGRFLLVKRGKPLDAAKRELYEETGIDSDQVRIKFEFFERSDVLGTDYYLFKGYCDDELDCKLNNENTDWDWFDMENLPSPLIPTLKSTLERIF